MQGFLPLPPRSVIPPPWRTQNHIMPIPGDARVLLTDLNHVGTWVARILADPQTLNKMVVLWEDERPISTAFEVGEAASGDPEAMRAQFIKVCNVAAVYRRC